MKKEDYPYPECKFCRTIDDCKHKEKVDDELAQDLPPDECPKPINVLRRTLRKRKLNKLPNKN